MEESKKPKASMWQRFNRWIDTKSPVQQRWEEIERNATDTARFPPKQPDIEKPKKFLDVKKYFRRERAKQIAQIIGFFGISILLLVLAISVFGEVTSSLGILFLFVGGIAVWLGLLYIFGKLAGIVIDKIFGDIGDK